MKMIIRYSFTTIKYIGDIDIIMLYTIRPWKILMLQYHSIMIFLYDLWYNKNTFIYCKNGWSPDITIFIREFILIVITLNDPIREIKQQFLDRNFSAFLANFISKFLNLTSDLSFAVLRLNYLKKRNEFFCIDNEIIFTITQTLFSEFP